MANIKVRVGQQNATKVISSLAGAQTLSLTELSDGRPDTFVASNQYGRFSEYQFTANDLEQFTGFVIKIVMISTNESFPVTLKDFRAFALA